MYSEIFLTLEFGGGWGGLYSSSLKSLERSTRRIYPCLMDFCVQFFAEVWSVLALQEIGQVLAPIIKSFYDITKCVSSNQKAATQIVSSMKSFHELFKHCWSDAFLQAFERYWLFSKVFLSPLNAPCILCRHNYTTYIVPLFRSAAPVSHKSRFESQQP